jgi:hypothetical protein
MGKRSRVAGEEWASSLVNGEARRLRASARRKAKENSKDLGAFESKVDEAKAEIEARKNKSYPLHVCIDCGDITAWISDKGACFSCAGGALESEPDWQLAPRLRKQYFERKRKQYSQPGVSSLKYLAHLLYLSSPYRKQVQSNWLSFALNPDQCAPIDPIEHYYLERPEKYELLAPDSSGKVIVFSSGVYCFGDGRWVRAHDGHYRGSKFLPCVWPASLPIDELASAWHDWQQGIFEFNTTKWQTYIGKQENEQMLALQKEKRDFEEAIKKREQDELIHEQTGTVSILDGFSGKKR